MNDIIFHSLYSMGDMTSLKHTLLYFDKIIIPSNSYPVSFGEKINHILFLQLIPEDVYEQIEYLKRNGYVEVKKFEGKDYGNPEYYWNNIADELNKIGRDKIYPERDIHEIYKYIDLNPNHPEASKIFNEAVTFIAAVCLMEFSVYEQICCIDNRIIYDTLNLGAKAIVNTLDKIEIKRNRRYKKLKANILAQKLISVNLPSFEFETFEDILELKEKHRDSFLALQQYLFDISDKIELLPYEDGFNEEVDEFISDRVQPEIESFRKEVKLSAFKITRQCYKPSKSLVFSVMLSTVFPELSKKILFYGLSLNAIESILSNYSSGRKKIKESPFNIFMKLK